MATGFPAVKATCSKLSLTFDPWQCDLNTCILGKDAEAFYAADTVVMSIPRQVGKTWDVGALIFADCIVNPNTTVVWTAHRFKVSRETFDTLRALALTPAVAPYVKDMTTGAGNEQIIFRNGSRIVFAARERGAIRGFTKVRRLILDEGQILTEAALSDLVPTMNQAENPQIIIMGTPPKPKDPGEVFTRLREEALAGEAEGVLYVEFSADLATVLGEHHTGDLRADVATVLADDQLLDRVMRQCNPSYPHRTTMRAVKRMLKLLSPEDAGREAFGIWDEVETGDEFFGPGNWAAVQTEIELPEHPNAFGLAVAVDQMFASIVGAYTVEVDEEQCLLLAPWGRYESVDAAVTEARRLKAAYDVPVVIDGGGPTADSLDAVQIFDMTCVDLGDYATACAGVFDDVRHRRLLIRTHADLDAAVEVVEWRPGGDGRLLLGRRKSAGDISMLEAATLARHGSLTNTDAWGFYS